MFFAHVQQGDGCDYTIGCGHSFEEISGATTLAEAEKIVRDEWCDEDNLLDDDDSPIKSIDIYEVVSKTSIDVVDARAKLEAAKKRAEAREAAELERAEFERLKKKFGQ